MHSSLNTFIRRTNTARSPQTAMLICAARVKGRTRSLPDEGNNKRNRVLGVGDRCVVVRSAGNCWFDRYIDVVCPLRGCKIASCSLPADIWQLWWLVARCSQLVGKHWTLVLEVSVCVPVFFRFRVFTARRNARIASAVLATAIPSVRPSGTRRYCVKTTARSTVQFVLPDSKMCLVLYKPKNSTGTTPSPWNLGSKWPKLSWKQRGLTRFAL